MRIRDSLGNIITFNNIDKSKKIQSTRGFLTMKRMCWKGEKTLEIMWLNEFSLSIMNRSQNPMFILGLRTYRNYNFDMKNEWKRKYMFDVQTEAERFCYVKTAEKWIWEIWLLLILLDSSKISLINKNALNNADIE